jgi:hypothetical protein
MRSRASAPALEPISEASLIVGARSPEFLVIVLVLGLLAAGALLLFAATSAPWLLVAVPVLAVLSVAGWVLFDRRRTT